MKYIVKSQSKSPMGLCILLPILMLLVGCDKPDVIQQLQDEDPVIRIRAIKQAAQQGITEAVPLLVDRLEEDNEAVRFFAIASLRRLVGTDCGYDYKDTVQQREEAIERWRQKIAKGKLSGQQE